MTLVMRKSRAVETQRPEAGWSLQGLEKKNKLTPGRSQTPGSPEVTLKKETKTSTHRKKAKEDLMLLSAQGQETEIQA